MRLSTTLLSGLTILGFCSGCTMFGNPLASRTDPAEAARERHASEVAALIARGDYEGAQRLMDQVKRDTGPVTASVFEQTHTPTLEASRERMIEQLLASQPAEWREMLRQKYAQLGTARLQELVATEQQLRGIGQGVSPDPSVPTLAHDPSIQLAGNQQRAGQAGGVTQAQSRLSGETQPTLDDVNGFGIGFPQRQPGGELHAPDPGPQGANRTAQPPAGHSPAGEAPRLPEGLDFRVSQAGHQSNGGPGSIQTVSGTQAHSAAYSSGPAAGNAFGRNGSLGSGPLNAVPSAANGNGNAGQLPQIIPGNGELYGAPSRNAAATSRNSLAGNQQTPTGQTGLIQPTAGYSTQPASSNGGVSLENRIEIDSGTISGSATTQLGSTTSNPFAALGQPPVATQPGVQITGSNVTALPGGFPQSDLSQQPGTVPPGSVPTAGQPADQSLIPGVIRGGYESLQNLTTSVTERGLRTFGAIGNDGVAAPQMAQTVATAGQPATIDSLIAAAESDLARSAPGDTEIERLNHVRKQVNLRMLYLIADRIDQSIEPVSAADPADQEFWQQLFFAYVNYFDAQQMPHASDRATQTIDQLRTAISKLRHRADLQLKNVTFCHHIVSFGDYERFSTDQFTPGQPLLLYAEVENFFSTRTETDRYRTVLQSQIEVYDNSNMQRPVVTIPFDPSEDICRNHRRDFFHSYEFTVPQDLQPGLYTLVLRVTDQLSQKVATSRLNFRVE
ncbi:hypothetical protein GC176_03560 [bacterium]|nr:hypothetical protein [bacterium]